MAMKKKYCLVCGTGEDICEIGSFDSALLDAGVGNYNLVKISSILPPGSQRVYSVDIADGSILYTAYISKTITDCSQIAVAIAVAIPEDLRNCGVIIECSLKGSRDEAEKKAAWLAEKAMEKRGITITRVEAVGAEITGKDVCYSTAFAGLVLFG